MTRRFRTPHQHRLDRLGEDAIFRKYHELRSTRALCVWLGIPPESRAPLYRWLKSVPGRWQRWMDLRRWVGHEYAEDVLELLEGVSGSRADRRALNRAMWRADHYFRPDW